MYYEWYGRGAGLEAWIWIEWPDGKELDMYFVDGNTENWIPSVEGQQFEVCWCAKFCTSDPQLRSLDLGATVWLDGVEIGAGVLESTSIIKREYASVSGRLVAADKERPCQFGRLALTDNDDDQARIIPEEDLNTIRVELKWGRSYKTGKVDELGDEEETYSYGPIKEKKVKRGNVSSAILGDPVKVPSDPDAFKVYGFRCWRSLDPALWVVRHASLAWLEAEGIAPKPKQAQDVIDVDEVKSESESEPNPAPSRCKCFTRKRKRACGLELTDGFNTYIKQELDDTKEILSNLYPLSSKRPRAKMKYEPFNPPAGSFINGEVIDLTGDDSD